MFLVISVNTVKFVPKSKFDNDIQRSLLKQNMNNLIQHNITYVVTNTFVAILTLEPSKFLKLLKKLLFSVLLDKAMRKKIISGFSCFVKDETKFFSYSNLIRNLIDSFVFAKILRNKCGRKCKTRKSENKYKNN